MVRRRYWLLIALLVLIGVFVSTAQDINPVIPPPEDADIAISFPPPVFVVNGMVDIRGSADVIDMENYFVEYRPLVFENPVTLATPLPDADRPWFPATLPGNQAVRNGMLGTWNTTTARDGLYEIRLIVNVTNRTPTIFRVSPVRVLNNPTDQFLSLPTRIPLQPTPTQFGNPVVGSTLIPTPTALDSGEPMVTALTDSNVRMGDHINYPRAGSLLTGETARVLGVSSFGSGWYYIEIENGRHGFIAPNLVRFTGDASNLERIQPPPLPTPPATATPLTTANLQVTGLRLDPSRPRCGESYDIFINVQNTGTGRTNSSGLLTVVDRHVRTGSSSGSTIGGFPQIEPGASYVVVATLTIDTYYKEDHDVIITLDPNGQVFETNEGDNFASTRYNLRQGGCG